MYPWLAVQEKVKDLSLNLFSDQVHAKVYITKYGIP